MSALNRYCALAGLAALGLAAPAAVLAQDSTAPLPIDILNSALTDTEPDGATTWVEQVEALRQQMARQSERFDKRLNQQAQRIERLEQTIEQMKGRRLPPANGQEHRAAADPAAATSARAAQQQANPDGDGNTNTDRSADTNSDPDKASDEAAAADPQPTATIARKACTSALDDRFQFDVFFQGAGENAVAAAVDQVQAIDLMDWFVLADADRLYVGRYGTCDTAKRRRRTVHGDTGLALTIAAVEPNPGASAGDSGGDAVGVQAPPVRNPPFFIVGVELRGDQARVGVAGDAPQDLGDITWLAPGQTYGAWRLDAIHSSAGTTTFTVRGQRVTVVVPE